jgi:hypothetical protein
MQKINHLFTPAAAKPCKLPCIFQNRIAVNALP